MFSRPRATLAENDGGLVFYLSIYLLGIPNLYVALPQYAAMFSPQISSGYFTLHIMLLANTLPHPRHALGHCAFPRFRRAGSVPSPLLPPFRMPVAGECNTVVQDSGTQNAT